MRRDRILCRLDATQKRDDHQGDQPNMPKPKAVDAIGGESLCFHLLIVPVLVSGYLVGGVLAFAIPYAGVLRCITDATGRLALQLYGMGMLGASLYCSKWWSRDLAQAVEERGPPPNLLDACGYAFTIVGGGVTGVVFYIVARSGMNLLSGSGSQSAVRPGAGAVLALIGGLFHFKVEDVLGDLFDKVSKAKKAGDEAEKTSEEAKKAGGEAEKAGEEAKKAGSEAEQASEEVKKAG